MLSVFFISSYLSTGLVPAANNDNYPNDPYLGKTWQYAKVGIDVTWDAIDPENEIVVAVLDKGLDVNLTDLEGRITAGYDFLRKDFGYDWYPGPWHHGEQQYRSRGQ